MLQQISQTIRNYTAIKNYFAEVTAVMEKLPVASITQVIDLLEEARLHRRNVYIFGNGGSAATASHFAADLAKGTICSGKPRLKALALTENISLLSAWANDDAYENVFAEQVENLVEPGDVVIGISGSGNSPNVLNGIKAGKDKGATTVGFVGFDGGQLKDLADISVVVPGQNIQQAEDVHLLLEHVITLCLKEQSY